jgi:NADH-quinone oxidoreductase subunit H
MKFAVIELADYVAAVFLAALAAVVFLGGWQVPFLFDNGFHFGGIEPVAAGAMGSAADIPLPYPLVIAMRIVAMCFKTIALVWLQFMLRWTLPRFRYDQVMTLGWKVLLPVALANLLITALIVAIV